MSGMNRPDGGWYYGGGGTIHGTGHVDVETKDGEVVAVWFRCMPLPFKQSECHDGRAKEMRRMYANGERRSIIGIDFTPLPSDTDHA